MDLDGITAYSLLKKFQQLQEERVHTYKIFHEWVISNLISKQVLWLMYLLFFFCLFFFLEGTRFIWALDLIMTLSNFVI